MLLRLKQPSSGTANVLILYNTLRIMGPAFSSGSGQQKTDIESFATPEKSPVDIAPPVAALLAHRAFPPVRSVSRAMTESSRQTSIVSVTESTAHLLPPRPGHAHSSSNASSATSYSSLQRSITPVEELNQLIIPNAPMTPQIRVDSASDYSSDSDESPVNSLPAPRRPDIKKPRIHRPSIPSAIKVPAYPEYVAQNGMLSAVTLQTAGAAPKRADSNKRDSFLSMYTNRSPAQLQDGSRLTFGGDEGVEINVTRPSPPRRSIRPSASTGQFEFATERFDMSAFTSPRAAPTPPSDRSSAYSSSQSSAENFSPRSGVADLPLSPFADGLAQRAVPSPEHARSMSANIYSPAFGTMSALARDAVVRNATKKSRRRSKSLDITPRRNVPDSLRPRTPSSTSRDFLPSVSTTPMGYTFPATPRTPGSALRPRSPAPPLPSGAACRSPRPSIRDAPVTPMRSASAGRA